MICPKCKKAYPDYVTFCAQCGTKLISNAKQVKPAKAPKPTKPRTIPEETDDDEEEDESSINFGAIFKVLAVLMVIALIGVGGYFGFKYGKQLIPKKEEKTKATTQLNTNLNQSNSNVLDSDKLRENQKTSIASAQTPTINNSDEIPTNTKYNEDEICFWALNYYEDKNAHRPAIADADHYENSKLIVHIYDIVNYKTNTYDWMEVDMNTAIAMSQNDSSAIDLATYKDFESKANYQENNDTSEVYQSDDELDNENNTSYADNANFKVVNELEGNKPRVLLENYGTDNSDGYILPDAQTAYYSVNDLRALSKETLKIARNEILARHGRKFKNDYLQEYFFSKSWYQPKYDPDNFDEMMMEILNDYEKENVEIIKQLEAE